MAGASGEGKEKKAKVKSDSRGAASVKGNKCEGCKGCGWGAFVVREEVSADFADFCRFASSDY
jgi:hypothetical protein